MTSQGKLLVIDGPDGAGKTTALKFIQEAAIAARRKIETVNILSGHKESARMRQILTDRTSDINDKAELLLYAAAQENTMHYSVRPLLALGIDVLIDRGPLSNFAYQVQSRDHKFFDLWLSLYSAFRADATLLLTCNVTMGLERCASRSGVLDRLELRPVEFHQRLYTAYRDVLSDAATQNPVFAGITGMLAHYDNDGTLEELRSYCSNFVDLILLHPRVA